MQEIRKKFQDLLGQLFQFDSADLDFGIYRCLQKGMFGNESSNRSA